MNSARNGSDMIGETLQQPDAPGLAEHGSDSGGGWRSAVLGVILGMDAAGHCLAIATLCFSGALASGLGLATGAFLLGSAIITIALVLFSGFRVVLGIAQDTSIAILAPAVIAVGVALDASPEDQVEE